MSAARAGNRKIAAVAITFLVLAAIQVLFDPFSYALVISENLEARLGIPQARAKWEGQQVTHYRFDVNAYIPLRCMIGGNIEVMNEVVINVGPRSDGEFAAGFPSSSAPDFLCDPRNFTMSRLFAEFGASDSLFITAITFDREYGFISSLGFGYGGGHGLLEPRVSDCCGGFSIENFRVLGQNSEP